MSLAINLKTFDSHKTFKLLKESGFNEKQAEAVLETVKEAASDSTAHLATKEDLNEVKQDLNGVKQDIKEVKQDIQLLEVKFDGKITKVESKINHAKWQVIASVLGIVVLLPIIQIIYKHFGLS